MPSGVARSRRRRAGRGSSTLPIQYSPQRCPTGQHSLRRAPGQRQPRVNLGRRRHQVERLDGQVFGFCSAHAGVVVGSPAAYRGGPGGHCKRCRGRAACSPSWADVTPEALPARSALRQGTRNDCAAYLPDGEMRMRRPFLRSARSRASCPTTVYAVAGPVCSGGYRALYWNFASLTLAAPGSRTWAVIV